MPLVGTRGDGRDGGRPPGQEFLKVLDFGLAKILEAEGNEPLVQSQGLFGTIPYMSPEQVNGEAVDARSDLYSVGVILYEFPDRPPPVRVIQVQCPRTFAGSSRAQAAPRCVVVAADTPVSAAPPPCDASTSIPRPPRQRSWTSH